MAKRSKIAKDRARRETVARSAPRRAALKAVIADPAIALEVRLQAQRRLWALPRDASPTRLRNRDSVTGRPRGYLRKFGVSRITFRELAHRGELPGVSKASW